MQEYIPDNFFLSFKSCWKFYLTDVYIDFYGTFPETRKFFMVQSLQFLKKTVLEWKYPSHSLIKWMSLFNQ